MARKSNQDAKLILEALSKLPWKWLVVIGIAAYFGIHALANRAPSVPIHPGQVGQYMGNSIVIAFASIGQYLVPLFCFFAALLSYINQRKKVELVKNVQHAGSFDGMTWQDFEMLVGQAFRLQGFRVLDVGGSGPDGGIDLVMLKGSEKFLVQCKHWRAQRVGVDVVRELYGVMAAKGSTAGFVVTSGRYTEDAVKFSEGRNITLIEGAKLIEMCQQARRSLDSATKHNGQPKPSVVQPPVCQKCSSPMVLRTAKQGAHIGSKFWGCANYPSCKNIQPVSQ
jgi:restriction system protein